MLRWPFGGLNPTSFLSGAAAGAIGLINSTGNIGRFVGPPYHGMDQAVDRIILRRNFGAMLYLAASLIGAAISKAEAVKILNLKRNDTDEGKVTANRCTVGYFLELLIQQQSRLQRADTKKLSIVN
jgi:hypothetical protein